MQAKLINLRNGDTRLNIINTCGFIITIIKAQENHFNQVIIPVGTTMVNTVVDDKTFAEVGNDKNTLNHLASIYVAIKLFASNPENKILHLENDTLLDSLRNAVNMYKCIASEYLPMGIKDNCKKLYEGLTKLEGQNPNFIM